MYIYRGAYSTGQINLTGQPSAGNTVTINGTTIEFVASGATGAQVNIGASSSATASNLLTYINANSASLLVSATITTPTSLVRLTSTGIGPANNSITLTRVGANISLSGATMTGASSVAGLQTLRRFKQRCCGGQGHRGFRK